jgi:hypothetical protein
MSQVEGWEAGLNRGLVDGLDSAEFQLGHRT